MNKLFNWHAGLAWHSLRGVPVLRIVMGLLIVGALLLGFGHATRFAEHTQAMLDYRYPLDGQEGTLLYEARLLRAGEPLYQPLQPDRVVAAPYPPVYYVALAALELVANPEGAFYPVTEQPIFLPGRMLSLAAMLSVAGSLWLMVWRLGGNLAIGGVAATLWLAFPTVQLWATRIKPDTLALAFTALGLLAISWYLTGERGGKTGKRLLVGAAGAFALAFFTKQTAVAAPAATGLALLLTGLFGTIQDDEREDVHQAKHQRMRITQIFQQLQPCLLFAGTYVFLIAITWLTLDLITAGQYSFHVWGLHPAEWWSYGRFLKYAQLILPAWPLMLLAASSFVLIFRKKTSTRSTDSTIHSAVEMPRFFALRSPAFFFCASYALIGTLTLVGAGTTGAHHNHLLEPQLALTLAGCSVAGASWRMRPAMRSLLRFALCLLASGLLLAQLWILQENSDWYDGEFDMRDAYGERFVALIMSQPGEVLADDVGLLLAAGRPLRYDDPATMGPAIRTGLWDQRALLAEVEDRRFGLVLLPFDATKYDLDPNGRWSPEFIATLRENYRILYRDMIFSYVPREDSAE